MDIWEAIEKAKDVLEKACVKDGYELSEAYQTSEGYWRLEFLRKSRWSGYYHYEITFDCDDEIIRLEV